MSTRLAFSVSASLLLLGACDATITEPYTEQVVSVAQASDFGCGLTGEGVALCWGAGALGQLGDGMGLSRAAPSPVSGGTRFSSIVTGTTHACGLSSSGRIYCWGSNESLQLGTDGNDLECVLTQENGFLEDRGNDCSTVPAPVATELRFKAIGAAAQKTCGLATSGDIWCWGTSWNGLGDSLTHTSGTPVKVTATVRFGSMAIGVNHACAIDTEGLGWCWGDGYTGATGLGTADSLQADRLTPTRIASTVALRAIAVGLGHSCGLAATGAVLCWGLGTDGQRGDSTTMLYRHTPLFVRTDRVFTALAAGAGRTCAIESGTGTAWCWGNNVGGSLGVGGSTLDRLIPAPVLGGLAFTHLRVGGYIAYGTPPPICGATVGGVYCWGPMPRPLTFEE